MYIPGLVSVSFRQLSPRGVLEAMARAGLRCVEWGGDVHVPAGDLAAAKEVAQMTRDAGISTVAYGSYFRLGQPTDDFRRCLDSACALGAPVLRVWAGTKGSADCGPELRRAWVEQLLAIDAEARARGVRVAPEFHIGTLTDSLDSLAALLEEAPELLLYWQPRWNWPEADRLKALAMIGKRLAHMHAFTWRHTDGREIRLPLADGEGMWRKVFAQPREDCHVLMEFVENDDPDNLYRDAAVLRAWLEATP